MFHAWKRPTTSAIEANWVWRELLLYVYIAFGIDLLFLNNTFSPSFLMLYLLCKIYDFTKMKPMIVIFDINNNDDNDVKKWK